MDTHDATETLDVLRRARASLVAGPFSFHDWSQCTCGHVFAGAQGGRSASRAEVRSPQPETTYAACVVAIAQVLSGDERRFTAPRRWYRRRAGPALAVRWISDLTMARARRRGDVVRRGDALAVLDEAILRFAAITASDPHDRPLVA
jgi:hypothetical protein